MTPDEQQLAIAEALGWEVLHLSTPGRLMGRKNGSDWLIIPDYPRDLNAMHEAEKTLDAFTKGQYRDWLVNFECDDHACFSSATVRAKAFLFALNLWRA
jgi:hypothetical protein